MYSARSKVVYFKPIAHRRRLGLRKATGGPLQKKEEEKDSISLIVREEEAPVDKGLRAELALKERNSAIKGRGWRGGGTIQGDKVTGQSLKRHKSALFNLLRRFMSTSVATGVLNCSDFFLAVL